VRIAGGLLDLDDLLEHGQVVARHERAAVDDHVALVRARFDGRADLQPLDVTERLAGWEPGRDTGDLDGRTLERVLRLGDESRVAAAGGADRAGRVGEAR